MLIWARFDMVVVWVYGAFLVASKMRLWLREF